jgi:uncharacterized membrane protein
MNNFITSNFYILLSIALGVVSQLIVKWKMSSVSLDAAETFIGKMMIAVYMLLDPFIILSIILTFLAGLIWMMAMTKVELSYAYPFTSLGFVLILFFSAYFFQENITNEKIIGSLLIMIGIIITGRSM